MQLLNYIYSILNIDWTTVGLYKRQGYDSSGLPVSRGYIVAIISVFFCCTYQQQIRICAEMKINLSIVIVLALLINTHLTGCFFPAK